MKKDNIDIVVEKRTKGKWFHLPVTDKGKQIPILTDAANETIVCFIGIKGQPNEANAAFICKAVNEYDNLKEQNTKLLSAFKNAVKFIECCPELAREERRPKGLEKWKTLIETTA